MVDCQVRVLESKYPLAGCGQARKPTPLILRERSNPAETLPGSALTGARRVAGRTRSKKRQAKSQLTGSRTSSLDFVVTS